MGKDWSLVIVFLLLGRTEAELRVTQPAVPRAAFELRYDQQALSRVLARVPRNEIVLTLDARAARLLVWLGLPTGVRVAAPQAAQTPFTLSSAVPTPGESQNSVPSPELAPKLALPADTGSDSTSAAAAGGPTLDVVRVAPEGPSIFAGTAPPGSDVTVLDGGKVVGTAKAGPEGDWSLATESKVTGERSDITVTLDPPASPSVAPEKSVSVATADTTLPPPPEPESETPSPAEQLVRELEKKVEAARSQAENRTEAGEKAPAAVPVSPVPAPVGPETDAAQSAAAGREDGQPNPEPGVPKVASMARESPTVETIPVPMQFEYRSAALTPEGRRAAGLLLEYLKLKSLGSITLSGHADERGGNRYNMELSRDRLAVIRRLLRDGGYGGRIKLLPLGESEPYQGVDRTRFQLEELMQLDRRVELRTSR